MKIMSYFYTENGKLKKYIYCSLCQAGPFKQDEEEIQFIKKGAVSTPINYCRKCATAQGRLNEFKPLPKPQEIKVVEVIKATPIIRDEKPAEIIVVTKEEKPIKDQKLFPKNGSTFEKDYEDPDFAEMVQELEDELQVDDNIRDKGIGKPIVKESDEPFEQELESPEINDIIDEVEIKEEIPEIVEEKIEKPVIKKEKKVAEKKTVENASRKGIKIVNHVEAQDGIYSFIVVRCLDGTIYSSVAADVKHSIKNMNQGKGSDYTKPKTRRPVQLLYSAKIGDKKIATTYRNEWEKKSSEEKQEFIKNSSDIN